MATIVQNRISGGSKIFMLVGLPGSGKSTFAASLEAAGYKVVSSDNLRARKGAFDEALGMFSKPAQLAKHGIVVDRCCVTVEERARLLGVMHNPDPSIVTVVYFNKDIEDCSMQALSRKNHPTLSPKKNVRSIVAGFAKKLVAPKLAEGFGRMEVVSTHEQGEAFLRSLGITPIEATNSTCLKKFPRTHHLLDAGGDGVTRDDLVMSAHDADGWLQGVHVNVEEKIDGANLGISLSEDYTPLFQNRSHFVNTSSGTQWKGLDRWWNDHAVLFTILEPGRHVLFGEWMALKHSIHYTKLPAYFIAFDVYDAVEDKFYSRAKLNEFLEPTGIPIIHTICNGTFTSVQELLPLLDTISVYGASVDESGASESLQRNTVEGVYLRVDDGDWLDRRCKIVRPDFVQGIEDHWCKRTPVKNCIKF